MNQAWQVLRKDLRLGPRSPIVLYAVLLPLLMTFLVSAVFGSLLDPKPKLGIFDADASVITAAAEAGLDGIEVTLFDDADDLRSRVEAHDVDAGIVLPDGFDAALRAGERPDLEFLVSGSSLASNRIILAVTTLDLVRRAAGQEEAVTVVITTIGDEDHVPIEDRLLPMIVFYAVVIAGLFLPASSMLDEREKRTLDALLVTPTRMGDVLVAKAVFGVILSVLMAGVTLAINGALGTRPFDLLLFILVGSVMMAEVGLILGCLVKDANSLYTAIKGGGIFIFLPVIFVIWPGLPQWIPRIAPTYYFIIPIYEIAVTGATLGDHWLNLLISVVICVALVPAVAAAGRRAERRLAVSA